MSRMSRLYSAFLLLFVCCSGGGGGAGGFLSGMYH